MDRRTFLQSASLSVAALASSSLLTAKDSQRFIKNWAWIPIDEKRSLDDWKRMLGALRAAGISAILPEIYNGRYAYFPSQHLPVKADFLTQLLPLAHAEEVEVHAWMWCMPCMIPEMIAQHRDWYNVNAKGESAADKPAYVEYYKFLDPGRPEVRGWIQQTVKELAGISELRGVHLDYIRHPDAILPRGLWSKYGIVQDRVYPQYDYGYSDYERREYSKKVHVDPLTIKNPTADPHWMRFRYHMVTGLVNDFLVPAAHAKGKMITAAVFPGPTLAREMVRQDWGRWHLDAFLPMLYNQFYEQGPEWVSEQTREGVHTVKPPVYSGLFIYSMDEPTFSKTVEMALAAGASGISIFDATQLDAAKAKSLRQITESHS